MRDETNNALEGKTMDSHLQRKIDALNEMIEALRHGSRFSDGGISEQFSEAAHHLELTVACLEYVAELKSL